jgi:hypothetical protein
MWPGGLGRSEASEGQCHFQCGSGRAVWRECVASCRWNLSLFTSTGGYRVATMLLTPGCFHAQCMDRAKHHYHRWLAFAVCSASLCIASLLLCQCRVNPWPVALSPHPQSTNEAFPTVAAWYRPHVRHLRVSQCAASCTSSVTAGSQDRDFIDYFSVCGNPSGIQWTKFEIYMKYCDLQGSLGGLPVGQLPELFELPFHRPGHRRPNQSRKSEKSTSVEYYQEVKQLSLKEVKQSSRRRAWLPAWSATAACCRGGRSRSWRS